MCPYSMMESVANLKKNTKKGAAAENTAFQQLFLLVGMHLFKVQMSPLMFVKKTVADKPLALKWDNTLTVLLLKAPEELLDIMKDLQSCVDKAQEKKAKKKKKQGEFSFTTSSDGKSRKVPPQDTDAAFS